MITPPGVHPEDAPPGWPMPSNIVVSYEEAPDGRVRVWAWALGSDGSRCTREAFLEGCVARAYPEMVGHTARYVAYAVRNELAAASLWDPPLPADF